MRKYPTELSNRSRFALWRKRINLAVPGAPPFLVTNARSMLRACGGEIDLRSPMGRWAQKISKAVDAGNSVITGIDSPKHNTASQVQLSSEFGRWMPKIGPTRIG